MSRQGEDADFVFGEEPERVLGLEKTGSLYQDEDIQHIERVRHQREPPPKKWLCPHCQHNFYQGTDFAHGAVFLCDAGVVLSSTQNLNEVYKCQAFVQKHGLNEVLEGGD